MNDTKILTNIENRLLDLNESWTSLDRSQLAYAINEMCVFIDKNRY